MEFLLCASLFGIWINTDPTYRPRVDNSPAAELVSESALALEPALVLASAQEWASVPESEWVSAQQLADMVLVTVVVSAQALDLVAGSETVKAKDLATVLVSVLFLHPKYCCQKLPLKLQNPAHNPQD